MEEIESCDAFYSKKSANSVSLETVETDKLFRKTIFMYIVNCSNISGSVFSRYIMRYIFSLHIAEKTYPIRKTIDLLIYRKCHRRVADYPTTRFPV